MVSPRNESIHEIECVIAYLLCTYTAADAYIVADCGGGTCDVTTRVIRDNNKIGELVESKAKLTGGNWIDVQFLNEVAKRLDIGIKNMYNLLEKNYHVFNQLVHVIFWPVKFRFNGKSGGRKFLVRADRLPSELRNLANPERVKRVIEFDFDTVESFFNDTVDEIVHLIRYVGWSLL